MVLGVCRRVLRDERDVEDAFQATFLFLVRRAAAIRDGERVGRWLHGVAHRVAVRRGPIPRAGSSMRNRWSSRSSRLFENSPCVDRRTRALSLMGTSRPNGIKRRIEYFDSEALRTANVRVNVDNGMDDRSPASSGSSLRTN